MKRKIYAILYIAAFVVSVGMLFIPRETIHQECATYQGNDTFVTSDGNAWLYESDYDFQKGDIVWLTMSDNATENVTDDIITNAEILRR